MQAKLSNWQSTVWLDKNRYRVINCGRRAGKTYLTVSKMIDFCSKNPGCICWYVAPTYKQAEEIAWQMILEFSPEWAVDKTNSTKLKILFKNGSSINLKGAEDPDKLRGVRIDLCIFDECAFMDRWDEVWKVVRPTLADSKADCWFISTPNGFNHFYDLSQKQELNEWSYHHFTSYDNPHIDNDEIDAARSEMDEDSFAQEWLGEFRKMSGLIYKSFDRDIHMVDVPDISQFTIMRSIDFGYGHKTALIYFAINTTGTEIYAFDGIYQTGLTIPDIAEAIKIKDTGLRISNAVADSAQPGYIEQLKREGINFSPVEKGPDSVRMGIAKVASLLQIRKDTGKPTLMFSKTLPWIAEEMQQYRWMENKTQGYVKEVPLKRNDDSCDAVRYFAMHWKKSNEDEVVNAIARNRTSRKRWSI